jgi:NAD(P)-dependent dehydrogenase (short-subunit alcohol dehydrogenase family)
MASEFQSAGARVALSSRDADAVRRAIEKLPNPANAFGVKCDVRELAQVEQLAQAAVSRFGRIDVWINNAGVAHRYAKFLEIAPPDWRASIETNLIGAYHGCRVALAQMLSRRAGQIINILGMGADRPAPNQTGYGASKAALMRLTESLALEYADTGVAICSVRPGMMWTDMLTGAEGVQTPEMQKRMEWAMRVFGNPPSVPAQFVVRLVERGGKNGKSYQVVKPTMFMPRMISEMLGVGKRNPRPWE